MVFNSKFTQFSLIYNALLLNRTFGSTNSRVLAVNSLVMAFCNDKH